MGGGGRGRRGQPLPALRAFILRCLVEEEELARPVVRHHVREEVVVLRLVTLARKGTELPGMGVVLRA